MHLCAGVPPGWRLIGDGANGCSRGRAAIAEGRVRVEPTRDVCHLWRERGGARVQELEKPARGA